MARTLVRSLLILLALCFLELRPSEATAQPISPKNPFKGYNVSGVNYGSQQWEKSHRGKSSSSVRTRRVISRRR